MNRLREQDGIALISATIILTIVLGLAVALLTFANSEQHASAHEQAHEVAYSMAEAALNAQISTLGAQWASSTEWTTGSPPSSCALVSGSYPTGCVCNTSTTFNGCPSPTGSWQTGYTTSGQSWCPPGTHPDAWGSSATTSWSWVNNGWTTYVRDDAGGTSSLFSSATDETQAPYDANSDGDVWVRAVGSYDCQTAIVLSKVAEQLLPISFPRDAVTANSFATGNNGNKVILDTSGTSGTFVPATNPNSSAGHIATRCVAVSSNCASYRSGQVSPDTCGASATAPNGCTDYSSTPATTLDSNGLAGLKTEAAVYGTWYSASAANQARGAKACPTSASQLNSVAVPGGVAPVYIDTDCPSLSFTGNSTINSAAQPGFLVLTDQSFSLGGTVTFYGFIYDANLCATAYTTCTTTASSASVSVTGNAAVQGALNVDGPGSIQFGESKDNFIYDSRVWTLLTEFAGADAAPNSFRQLPTSQ